MVNSSEIALTSGDDVAEKVEDAADAVANKTVEAAKTGIEKLKDEVGDIVHTAEEVGKEIWDDIKDFFGNKDKKHPNKTDTASSSIPAGKVRLF
jgi:hypothetical protein